MEGQRAGAGLAAAVRAACIIPALPDPPSSLTGVGWLLLPFGGCRNGGPLAGLPVLGLTCRPRCGHARAGLRVRLRGVSSPVPCRLLITVGARPSSRDSSCCERRSSSRAVDLVGISAGAAAMFQASAAVLWSPAEMEARRDRGRPVLFRHETVPSQRRTQPSAPGWGQEGVVTEVALSAVGDTILHFSLQCGQALPSWRGCFTC